MHRKWILNASPLILLHKIDFLKTMSELADTWFIPGAVVHEIERKRPVDDYITPLAFKSKVEILKAPILIPSIASWEADFLACPLFLGCLRRPRTPFIKGVPGPP